MGGTERKGPRDLTRPPSALRGRLRIVARFAEPLQVRPIVGASLCLRLDVVNVSGSGVHTAFDADLAQMIITLQNFCT
jgi:hypothetical protein